MTRPRRPLNAPLSERLATSGFRSTSQREHVYRVLVEERDHPTAEQVFIRAKKGMPEISMATVYNCLDALVRSGVARQVTVDRGAARFCPNMQEHCHFYCSRCETVFDVNLQPGEPGIRLPRGFHADHYEIAIHGLCPQCAKQRS
ncbi:MAG: Fur family transcriptional regulator [Verrucomicrobiota bacterium]